MKKLLYFFFITTTLLLFSIKVDAQYSGYYTLTFENTDTLFASHLKIDSNSIWQIGQPQKMNFTSGYNSPRAIVTDTINPITNNDTSVFYVYAYDYGAIQGKSPFLGFRYKLFCDTLTDYGKVEVSGDLGNNWIDLVRDANVYNFQLGSDTIFTGRTSWKYFNVTISAWYYNQGSYPFVRQSDTLIFRFSFIPMVFPIIQMAGLLMILMLILSIMLEYKKKASKKLKYFRTLLQQAYLLKEVV